MRQEPAVPDMAYLVEFMVEGHWRLEATPVTGFGRLAAVAQRILDEHYPEDIFGGAERQDADTSDPGVRLVRALRACRGREGMTNA